MKHPEDVNHYWTAELDRALVEAWMAGRSALQIARRADMTEAGKTRNAIIGRIHRLKLSGALRPRAPKAPRPVVKADDGRTKHARRAKEADARHGIEANGGHNGRGKWQRPTRHAQRKPDVYPKGEQAGEDDVAVDGPVFVADLPHGVGAAEVGIVGVPLIEVSDKLCRWPLWGMEKKPERGYRCCGAEPDGGSVYCAKHRKRATSASAVPVTKRKRAA